MCLLCAYTTRLVSGWPMSRGQARCGSCQCLRERAPTRGLRKGAAANFNPRRYIKPQKVGVSLAGCRPRRVSAWLWAGHLDQVGGSPP